MPPTRNDPAPSARDTILETAGRLFHERGVRAVGVDTIVAESGVAKMTLYRHFPAKDDLVVAYLQRANDQLTRWMDELVAPHAARPRRALEAIFDGVARLASGPHCRGCAFLGVAAEFSDDAHPGRVVARDHKKAILRRFTALARGAGAREPERLAAELLLVMDGAWGAARVFGPRSHASHAGEAARALVRAHCDKR